jgi:glycolate oxidase subunit GlcD
MNDAAPSGLTAALAQIGARLGERLTTNQAVRERHGKDETYHPGAPPDAVAFPHTTAEVADVVGICAAHGLAVIPFGTGTSLEGHIAALNGGVTLDLSGMTRVVEVNAEDLDCLVEAGVTRKQLNTHLRDTGLFFPIDPGADASLGGMAATRASGTNAVRYGTMRENVLGLTVVLADGEVIKTGGRARKSSAGYDLTRLFVGSEGTLGVITEATLALRPAPQRPVTLVATFATTAQTGQVVERVVTSGLVPSLLEVMDNTCICAVDDLLHADLDRGAHALLVAQSDTGGEAAVREIEALAALCREAGADLVHTTDDPAEGDLLLAARRMALPALERLGSTLIDDVAVPRSRIAQFLDGCDTIAAERGLTIGVVGHAGDGNMHPTICFDPTDADQRDRAFAAFDDILELGLSLGGTITGEHGVGAIKVDWLEREIGPVSLEVHRSIKAALDPDGLLNPGKVLRRLTR